MKKIGRNLFFDEKERKYYIPTSMGGFVWVPKASVEQIKEAGYTKDELLEELQRHEKERYAREKEHTEKKDIAPVNSEQEPYILMDKRDDEQIISEIQGRVLDEYVYSFPGHHGEVVGLSWAGVKEVARRMGNISIEEIKITETEDTYRVLAKAKDTVRGITMYGVSEVSKTMTLRDGRVVPDTFALQKAVSKAQRNAIRALIPETVIKTMIDEFRRRRVT